MKRTITLINYINSNMLRILLGVFLQKIRTHINDYLRLILSGTFKALECRYVIASQYYFYYVDTDLLCRFHRECNLHLHYEFLPF